MFNRKQYEKDRCLKRKMLRALNRPTKFCSECGEGFTPRHFLNKSCSKECDHARRFKILNKHRATEMYKCKTKMRSRDAYQTMTAEEKKLHVSKVVERAKRKRIERSKIPRACKRCRKLFVAPNLRFEFCSKECSDANSKELNRVRVKLPEHKVKRNAFLKKKNASNPAFRLRGLISKIVWRALKKRNCNKCGSVGQFLPYSIPQLKAHLESFFDNRNGFTWENHGKIWHIDHVIPHSLFEYTSLDSKCFRDCWALSNLRPMSVVENIAKSNRRIGYFDNVGQGVFLA